MRVLKLSVEVYEALVAALAAAEVVEEPVGAEATPTEPPAAPPPEAEADATPAEADATP